MKTIFHRSIVLLLVFLLAGSLPGPAPATAAPLPAVTCIWTGAASNFWSNHNNWTGTDCTGLSDGMTVTLAFQNTALRKSNNNDLAGLNVAGIGFDTSGGYTLSGNSILLTSGIGATGGINIVNLPIQLGNNIETNIVGTLHLDGAIGGSFSINKTGAGALDLDAINSFSGITVTGGSLTLSQNLSGGSGTITVQDGRTLTVASPVTTVANPLTLSGAGTGGLGALHYEGASLILSGPLALVSDTTIQGTNPTGNITLANVISGPNNKALTLDGPHFTFSGASSNAFTGLITVPRGTLTLDRSGGAAAVAGNLTVGDGVNTASVDIKADNQFSTASQVTLNRYATFNMEGHNQTISGMAASDRPCLLQLGGDQNTTLTFNTISGPQNYVHCDVTGTGTLLVTGVRGNQSFRNNDPSNPFNGSLDVQGTAASYLSAFHMAGSYYLHTNTGGGFLNPGSTVGSFLADNAWFAVAMPDPANRSQAGSLLLNGSGTDAVFEFIALNASGISVTGQVSLGNATLFVCYFTGFEPGLANTPENPKWRMLIQNDVPGVPVTGTFNGLPEGSQISMERCLSNEGVFPARLTYQGGDGNDLVVTRLVQDNLSLIVVPGSPVINQAAQLVATLAPLETAYGAAPSQKVAFYDGSTLLGEASFVGQTTATLNTGPFSLGGHAIQARMVGDPNFADAVSNTVSFRVGRSVFVPMLKK